MKFDFFDRYTAGAYSLDVGGGCTRYVIEGKTRSDFDSLLCDAENDGAISLQKRAIGENLFATLRFEDGLASLAYFNYNHTFCIVTDPLGSRAEPPLEADECERLTAPKVCFLDLHSPEASAEGNGLCMVYILSDGSFIVYDGGYYDDGEGLIAFLESHNARAEKPRIAAWVLTHSHGDHYFAMKRIAERYADSVTVENFIVNARDRAHEFEQFDPYLGVHFESVDLPRFEGARLIRPHTGQLLHFRDAAIEILCTQEEILPSRFRWLNETSIVSRVYLGGKSTLMPADAELGVDVLIPTVYGDALKSDFLQETHHGFSGGSYVFYELARPDVAFWTCAAAKFEKFCYPSYNNGYNHFLRSISKRNYHYGEGDVVIEL